MFMIALSYGENKTHRFSMTFTEITIFGNNTNKRSRTYFYIENALMSKLKAVLYTTDFGLPFYGLAYNTPN